MKVHAPTITGRGQGGSVLQACKWLLAALLCALVVALTSGGVICSAHTPENLLTCDAYGFGAGVMIFVCVVSCVHLWRARRRHQVRPQIEALED